MRVLKDNIASAYAAAIATTCMQKGVKAEDTYRSVKAMLWPMLHMLKSCMLMQYQQHI